ncbi:MAG: methylated-DNA--[protein]-cysteine S-methyltransferase [Desulfotalea sp.]
MLYYTTFKTMFCDIILVGDSDGIQQLHLDTGEGKRQFSINQDWQRDDTMFAKAKEQIKSYCRGELKQFSIPIKLQGTEFQKKVWRALCEIPSGETRTYGEIAKYIGSKNGGRAVGNANSKNPIPLLVPCHRVIGANGKLTGFAHGLTIKRKLLAFEKIN